METFLCATISDGQKGLTNFLETNPEACKQTLFDEARKACYANISRNVLRAVFWPKHWTLALIPTMLVVNQ